MATSKQVENNDQLDIDHKLDVIIRLLGAILTKGANKSESIAALGRLQLPASDIAGIVGVTPHHVRQTLYVERKKAAGGKPSEMRTEGTLIGGEVAN